MTTQQRATPFDPTIDAQPLVASGNSKPQPTVGIVEGSTPELSAETNNLLRDRLRAASLLLFVGFLAFFVKALFDLGSNETTFDWILFADHAAITIITGIVGLRLCTECPEIRRHLRLAEVMVFGGSALFFVLVSCALLKETASEGYIRSIAPIWLLLIFTYALFVPNTWRRAALVIGSMTAAPILLVIGFWFTSPATLRENPHFRGYPIEVSMLMTLCAVIAVWGVHTIGTLRRVAFEARQLGQYRLKQRIGQGGMGEVYLAEHVLLKRPCAIKLIRPEKAGDAKSLARFEREVKATAKLTHWNTVEIFDYGRADDGTFYYVMEYLPGLNLGQLVEMHGALPPERVIHFLTQTCDALGEAHRENLIHRDIKPGNIFAANRGGVYDVVKLLDFGLAKPLADVNDSGITQEGSITGSPLFMSPEQASGDIQPDARSDIYSVGVVAYYLLAGEPPFNGTNAMKVMIAHISQPPIPLMERNASVPEDLSAIVMRCLHKDPQDRFQDTESLREALADCRDAENWTRVHAHAWWENYGCPTKKALDREVFATNST
ncbi:MAG TPA: serine/threonine-protein kinase [Pirellulaceae bacterium]|nr:serine/threonine-protein kinase [Pirellulaceae bacterium]